ncbi:hypothetical protein Q3G72_009408 [Acer saccharum]|nr:hypothetical protein Q3G72_009408 [Acer saccharum]
MQIARKRHGVSMVSFSIVCLGPWKSQDRPWINRMWEVYMIMRWTDTDISHNLFRPIVIGKFSAPVFHFVKQSIYMAYLSKTALIFFLVTIFYIASLEGRKVLNMENTKGGRPLVPEHSNLVASHVLQNGPTPTIPSPNAKSVQMAQNGRISVTLHNAAIYRYLGASVPSPGIGN